MRYFFFLTLTTIIIFFIYLGMAYITTMPPASENFETIDSIEKFDIKPIPKRQFQSKSIEGSINIEPKKFNNLHELKSQNFLDFSEQLNQNKKQIHINRINTHVPVDLAEEAKDSIMNTDLATLMNRPIYPYEAYRNNIDDWVLLKLFITKKGTVENVELLDSEPKGIFENVAIKTAYKKVFPIKKGNLDPKKHTRNLKIHYKADEQFL